MWVDRVVGENATLVFVLTMLYNYNYEEAERRTNDDQDVGQNTRQLETSCGSAKEKHGRSA
ncbi:hypothetical protein KSC_001300 [Ktedonobacter sp. SOSP1-52]|nr:hypothetical protein KSC_001300 [Ktedonobacter sp. SOSP1-52]